LIANRLALRFVSRALAAEQRARIERFLSDRNLPGGLGDGETVDWSRHPVSAAWCAAVETLGRDADAALPDAA
jgi:hypothetical protein